MNSAARELNFPEKQNSEFLVSKDLIKTIRFRRNMNIFNLIEDH